MLLPITPCTSGRALRALQELTYRVTCLLLVLFGTTSGLYAQEATVVGHITDGAGEHLSFATVRVLGSVIGASSDLEGHYELEVPPGRIRLVYSYVGYRDVDTTITVANDEREIELDVVMRESDNEGLPDIIVFGTRAVGQAQALKLQQSGLMAQTIVHSELFNKYPDITIAETVSRIPGVSIIRGINEGEIVQVRGLPEQYTAVSLNGQRLPTVQPEADQTGTLDLIQSNLVEEVRVIKSRTADMDGDAIGGTVDFRVRQPERQFEVLALGGIGNNFGFDGNPDQSTGITQLTGVLNSEIADEKVYALAAGSYFKHNRGVQQRVFDYTSDTSPTLFASRPVNTNQQTERRGFVGAVELRPSIYNRLRISYNYANTTEEVISRQLFTRTGELTAPFEPARRTAAWTKERQLELVALEAENNFPKTRIDYQLSFSQTREDLVNRRSNFAVRDNLPGGRLTAEQASELEPTDDLGDTPFRERLATQEDLGLEEDVAILSLNITRYLNQNKTGYIKIGGRYRTRDRTYGIFSASESLAGDVTGPGTFPGVPTARLVDSIPDLEIEGLRYSGRQRIQSYYAMYAANFTSRISLSAGARYEKIEVETEEVDRPRFGFDQDNLFPSLNLTFRTSRRSKVRQARLSFYQAVAYANYATYLSDRRVTLNRLDEFSIGNQLIQNTKSNNIDLTFERYGRRDGQLTAGIYYKSIKNPTLRVSETDYTSSINPVYVTQLVNTPAADLVGFELGIYQNLGFLGTGNSGGTWRYFNFNATYNFNALSAESRRFNFESFTLPQAPRQTANASIVYNNPGKGYSVVVATNFRDRIFDRVLDDRPVYRNSVFSLDVSGDVKVYKDFGLYARLNNLTNHPFREFFGEPNDAGILRTEARYGIWGVIGVRYQNR